MGALRVPSFLHAADTLHPCGGYFSLGHVQVCTFPALYTFKWAGGFPGHTPGLPRSYLGGISMSMEYPCGILGLPEGVLGGPSREPSGSLGSLWVRKGLLRGTGESQGAPQKVAGG